MKKNTSEAIFFNESEFCLTDFENASIYRKIKTKCSLKELRGEDHKNGAYRVTRASYSFEVGSHVEVRLKDRLR